MSIIYQQDILTITDDYAFDRSLKYMDKTQLSGVSTKLNKQDQITDLSSFTKIYNTSIPYGDYGNDVDSILDLTNELTIINNMDNGLDYAQYDEENQIGAYAGYDFNGSKNISAIKIWVGRPSRMNWNLIVTVEYLDENGNWNEIIDKNTISLPYPRNMFLINVDKTIYGIRWIHKKDRSKTENTNIIFYGMAIYENNNNNNVCQLLSLSDQAEAISFYDPLAPDFEDYNLGKRAGYIQTQDGKSNVNTLFAISTQTIDSYGLHYYTVHYRCQTNRKYTGVYSRTYDISTYSTDFSTASLKITIINDGEIFSEEKIFKTDVQSEVKIIDGLFTIQYLGYSPFQWKIVFLKNCDPYQSGDTILWNIGDENSMSFSISSDTFPSNEIGFNTNDGVLSTTFSTNLPIFPTYDLAYRYLTVGDNASMAVNCKRQTATDMALLRRVMMPNWRVQSVVNYGMWYSHSIGDRIHYRYDMTTGGRLVRNTDEPVIMGAYRYNRAGDYIGCFVISKTNNFLDNCTGDWSSFNHISPQRLTPLNHPYYVYSCPGTYVYYTTSPGVYIPDMKDQFVGYGNATWYEDTGYNITMFASKSANGVFYEDGDVDCQWLGVAVDWLLY